MKNTIGIFGDSFADPGNSKNFSMSWTRLLSTKKNKVKNFAKIATSLFWSYENFQKYYRDFETIIFCVTDAGRLHNDNICLSGYSRVERILKNKDRIVTDQSWISGDYTNDKKIEILESAKNYFLYLQNDRQDKFLQKSIVREIIETCEKENRRLILIPSFDCSVSFQNTFNFSMMQITKNQLEANFEKIDWKEEKSTMVNHMTPANNVIFARLMLGILEDRIDKVSIDEFIFEKFADPSHFWEL